MIDPYFHTVANRPSTIVMSVLLAILATYLALDLAERVHRSFDRSIAALWVVAGSLAMGTGIWSMHFVGMSAAEFPFHAEYAPGITAFSWVTAVLAAAAFLAAAGLERTDRFQSFAAAGVSGLGAVAMYYVGIRGLAITPDIAYLDGYVAAAVLIAVVGSVCALWLFFRLQDSNGQRVRTQIAVATVYGGALASMHYFAMASTDFDDATEGLHTGGIEVGVLGSFVSVASTGFLLLILLTTSLERRAERRASTVSAALDETRQELEHATFTDVVTSLPNRLLFQDRLKQTAARAERGSQTLAVLFIDLDGFAELDKRGPDFGDGLLRTTALHLVTAARKMDTVAAVGRGQFAMIVDGPGIANIVPVICNRVAVVLRQLAESEMSIGLTASIGAAIFPDDGAVGSLMLNASLAATVARGDGGDCVRFFTKDMNDRVAAQTEWLDDLRMAVERDEFELHYQPKVRNDGAVLAEVEALLRWRHPVRGLVSPVVFIPLAEQHGLIDTIGGWVIDEACRQIRAWGDRGLAVRVAVNVSVKQLRRATLPEEIATSLQRHRVDPGLLVCEITESVAMDDARTGLAVFTRLKALGLELSIDDFGTGYSSLAYLHQLPVSQLKIDRSFVKDLGETGERRAIVAAIIGLAHTLKLEVVAEGVETVAQQAILHELQCDKLQGFLFAKPMRAAEAEAFMTAPPSAARATDERTVLRLAHSA